MGSGMKIIPLGAKTHWGKIAAVGIRDGERYYMMVDRHRVVSLMPAAIVEGSFEQTGAGKEKGT